MQHLAHPFADILGLIEAALSQTARVQRNWYQVIHILKQVRINILLCGYTTQFKKYMRIRMLPKFSLLYQATQYLSTLAIIIGPSSTMLVTYLLAACLYTFRK
jgi:hypothetical protein